MSFVRHPFYGIAFPLPDGGGVAVGSGTGEGEEVAGGVAVRITTAGASDGGQANSYLLHGSSRRQDVTLANTANAITNTCQRFILPLLSSC